MWKSFLIVLGVVLVSNISKTQDTFNQRVHFSYPAAVLNGLHVLDSCFYTAGIVIDTVSPSFPAGLVYGKYSHEGELQNYKTFFPENKQLLIWEGDLQAYQDGFITSGEVRKDGELCAGLIYLTSDGEVSELIELSYFFPLHEQNFIKPTRPAVGLENKVLLPTRERNPVGTNNTETVLQLFDDNGNMLWRKNYGEIHGDWNDYPNNAVAIDNGFVVGSWLTNGNKVTKDFVTQHYLFAIDTTGTVLWDYYSPVDTLLTQPRALLAEEDGSLIVGSFLGEEFYVNADANGIAWGPAYIYKLNPPEDIEWTVHFNTPYPVIGQANSLRKIIKVSDGSGYMVAGHYVPPDTGEGQDIRGWLLKISSEGDSLWTRQLRFLGANNDDDFQELYDLEETPDGGFLMCGQITHYNAPPPAQQGWLIKVNEAGCLVPGCDIVATDDPNVNFQVSLSLYPNPTRSLLYLFLQDAAIAQRENTELSLVNAAGQIIKNYAAGRIDEVTHIMPVDDLPAGTYIVQYVANGRVLAAERVIIQ